VQKSIGDIKNREKFIVLATMTQPAMTVMVTVTAMGAM
jgi:hypothetical protein